MENITLTQIEISPPAKFKLYSNQILLSAWVISAIAISVHYLFGFSLNGPLAFFAILFLPIQIITIIWGWNEYYPKNYIIKTTINISMSDISIDNLSYPLKELENLEFNVNDHFGKRMGYPNAYSAGPSLSQGINNIICFKHNGREISLQFLLRSEWELQKLGSLLTQLYMHGISFKENYNGKSYGLKQLNYAEIQEYKKKFNLINHLKESTNQQL